jgi:type IV secretion system protein VirD4
MSGIARARRDPLPPAWELPAAATLGWVALAAMLALAGRGAASWVAGGGWAWPRTEAGLSASLTGLLAGHPAAGLTTASASALPAAAVVYLVVVCAEAAWLTVSALAALAWWRTWGPGMRGGLADRREVDRVLGLSRIRRNAAVIRPDLYGSSKATAGPS